VPLTTARGYPYSIPTDPTDVPQAIESLALAVDADVQARDASIHARPVFRLSSTSSVPFYATAVFTMNRVLPLEVEDVNVGGAITPIGGISQSRITPMLPGYWWFQAAMTFPRSGATSMDFIGITLQTNTQILARNATPMAPPPSDGANNLSVSGGSYFNGTTDYVQLIGTSHAASPAPGSPSMVVRNRYLLGMRMTEA